MNKLSTTQIIINVALFATVITYISLTKLAPITFTLFILPIIGLVAAAHDLHDNYKAAFLVSALSTVMLFGILYNSKEINLLHNSLYKIEGAQPLRDIICRTNPNYECDKTSKLSKKEEISKDPVAYVESIMAKLDMKLNEYERVNLKALEAAKENNEMSDDGIKSYKEYIANVKTSNYKSNFIRLTLFANTFSLETCNKYNSKVFCDDLASQTIPEIKMNQTIRFESFIRTGLMNHEQTKKYLDLVHDKLDKALDKRPDRVLTDREVNNIFESVPTKQ